MFKGLQETGFYFGTLIGQVNFKKKRWIYVKKNWLVPSSVFTLLKHKILQQRSSTKIKEFMRVSWRESIEIINIWRTSTSSKSLTQIFSCYRFIMDYKLSWPQKCLSCQPVSCNSGFLTHRAVKQVRQTRSIQARYLRQWCGCNDLRNRNF